MFGFGRHTHGPLYGALVDIGSGTIGIAVVESDLSKKLPTIIYQNRVTMRVGKSTKGGEENLRRVREMLLSVSLMLSEEGYAALRAIDPKARIGELCVTVSSPWSRTIVHNVTYKEDEPFRITPAILKDLIESAESEILERLRTEESFGKDGFEIVERATVGINVNEYPVKNPLKLEGKILELSHVAGLIPTKIMGSIAEIQDKLFPKSRLHAHTSMLSMYSVLADIFPRTHTFAIIDVTAEATEFGIVENNTLIENSFIKMGTNGFIESVMAKTERPLADIETNLRAFNDKSVTKDADVLASLAEYSETIREGVELIRERRMLPQKVVVTVREPFQAAFTEAVARGVRAAVKRRPDTVSVNKHLIEEISHGTGEDVYLALAARFFHKLHAREEDTDT